MTDCSSPGAWCSSSSGQRGDGVASTEGSRRRLGSGGRRVGQYSQTKQQQQQQEVGVVHCHRCTTLGWLLQQPGPSPSEEACGQGPEVGAHELVQLLQDLLLLLVHLREESRGEKLAAE